MSDNLIGRWHLVSWRQEYDDGRIVLPFGDHPRGIIDYTEPNFMSCTIARADRAKFESGGQWSASAEEKADAYDGYLSYCGTFELQGDSVLHHVEFSIYPNWVGSSQRRQFSFDGGFLNLRARLEEDTPEARTIIVQWSRNAPASAE